MPKKSKKIKAVSNWDNFLPKPIIRKKLGRNYRLVAVKRYIASKDVNFISFVALLLRSDNEYKAFVDNPEGYCHPLQPSDAELVEWYDLHIDPQKIASLEKPSSVESVYLNDYSLDKSDNEKYVTILESKDWVSRMLQDEYSEYLRDYYNLIDQQIAEYAQMADRPLCDYTVDDTSKVKIAYFIIPKTLIYLIAPFLGSETEQQIGESISAFLNGFRGRQSQDVDLEVLQESIEADGIARISRRKYPELIRADYELWRAIQKNETGNLALSTEEYEILETITKLPNYPLFINGRPGSGKSTILMYLFAEHLYMHLRKFVASDEEHLDYPPLYLTYSGRLLDVAKKSVHTIMRSNSTFAINNSIDFENDEHVRHEISRSFSVFHDFLRTLLPEDLLDKFDVDKRIEYPEFRFQWNQKRRTNPQSEIRKLSAELAWHVVRTFIKGMRDDTVGDDSFLDPESYSDLPRKQRTVDEVTYKLVYKHVWEDWYKPLTQDQGYWDSQDMVHAILDVEPEGLSVYPAIFCDEAQDFTRVELEFLFKLSVYSQRLLEPSEIPRVPFVFAGDPFQTLNPTGFDWDSVRSTFYEKLIESMDHFGYGKLSPDYKELDYNYRSTSNVVRFCNLIQLWRGLIFGIRDLKPQKLWFQDRAAPMNMLYSTDDPTLRNALVEQSEIVIILPCQEGEEDDYVRNDPLLSSLADQDENTRNFLSPMAAKGLEFSRVVLYKFGEDFRNGYQHLFDPIIRDIGHYEDSEKVLPLKYFVNRLYVAASRPTKRLIVADTPKGIQEFWKRKEIQEFATLCERYNNPSVMEGDVTYWSENDLAYCTEGTSDGVHGDRDNALELAHILKESGLSERSPYKLKLASANYVRAGRPQDALVCDAERAQLEGEWLEAGRIWLELNQVEDALNIFWNKRYFDAILHPRFEGRLEHRVADFLVDSSTLADCMSILDYIEVSMESPYERQRIAKYLQEVLDKATQVVAENAQVDFDFGRLYGRLLNLRQHVEFHANIYIGQIAFMAQRYEDAFAVWEQTTKSNIPMPDYIRDNFTQTRLEITPYPEKLEIFQKTERYDRILEWWRDNRSQPALLDERYHQQIVWDTLLKFEDEELIEDFLSKRDFRTAVRMYDATRLFNRLGNSKLASRFGKGFLNTALRYIFFKDNQQAFIHLLNDRLKVLANRKQDSFVWSVDSYILSNCSNMSDDWHEQVRKHSRTPRQERRLFDTLDDYLEAICASNHVGKLGVDLIGQALDVSSSRFDYVLNFYEMIGDNTSDVATQLEQLEARNKWMKLQKAEVQNLKANNRYKDAKRLENIIERKQQDWSEDAKEAENIVKQRKRDLSEDQVQAIKMFHSQDWPVERIANVMNLPVGIIQQAIEILED
jgi:hypothetical protein